MLHWQDMSYFQSLEWLTFRLFHYCGCVPHGKSSMAESVWSSSSTIGSGSNGPLFRQQAIYTGKMLLEVANMLDNSGDGSGERQGSWSRPTGSGTVTTSDSHSPMFFAA